MHASDQQPTRLTPYGVPEPETTGAKSGLSADVTDPPLTVAFLIRSLENQLKMHEFMGNTERGGLAEWCYIDGLRQSAAYLLGRLRAEGIAVEEAT